VLKSLPWAACGLFLSAVALGAAEAPLRVPQPYGGLHTVAVHPDQPLGPMRLKLGVSLVMDSAGDTGQPQARRRAVALLANLHGYADIWIMSMHAPNPEPASGRFDFSYLDKRMALVRETGSTPVITLCCAPDWMKGAAPGTTDWTRQAEPPRPEHYADFAELARRIALRYPQVKHYLVWSEIRGFWNPAQHRWDGEGYTAFYNKVYDALKSVSPEIKVGGPYVPIGKLLAAQAEASPIRGPYGAVMGGTLDVVDYWLRNKHGADFIAVDGTVRDRDGIPGDLFASEAFYADASRWIRSRSNLPLWWAEWYAAPETPGTYTGTLPHDEQAALLAQSLIALAPNADVALRWTPEGDASKAYEGDQESLWSDTRESDGGKPFPAYDVLDNFERCFPLGAMLRGEREESAYVGVLAAPGCIMLVNKTASDLGVALQGQRIVLHRYETVFLDDRGGRRRR